MTHEQQPAVDRHPSLPVDADVDTAGHFHGPVHLRWRYGYVVFLGGTIGTLARYSIGQLVPSVDALPLPTLVVNLLGAFALGLLLQALINQGPDHGWVRLARLHFGTGLLGSFTTYSSLAVESVLLAESGRWLVAVGYLVVTFGLGALLTAAGISAGTRLGVAR